MADPTTRLPLQELQAELAQIRSKAEVWSRSNITAACDRKTQHLDLLKRQKAELVKLEQQRDVLARRMSDAQQRMAEDQAQRNALQIDIDKMHDAEHVQVSSNLRTEASLEAEAGSLQSQEAALTQRDREQKAKLRVLQEAHQMYQKALGLVFRPCEGTEELELAFTDIDPQDPERTFSMRLHVQGDSTYAVSVCQPELPELPVLLEALRDSNNLSSFVRSARTAFQATVPS